MYMSHLCAPVAQHEFCNYACVELRCAVKACTFIALNVLTGEKNTVYKSRTEYILDYYVICNTQWCIRGECSVA